MKPLPMWFRITSWVMAALFALCVVLQYNDPDPAAWMAIYGAGLLATVAMLFRRNAAVGGFVAGLLCLGWSVYLIAQVWGVIQLDDLWKKMSEKGGAVEVGREAGGLMIQAVWLVGASAFRWTRA